MKAAGFIGVFVLALFGLCISPRVPHQLHLKQHERKYRALVHPPSRAIAYESDLGLLEGNGNHCDYFAGELRATTLTLEELQAAYGANAEVMIAPASPPEFVFSPRERLLAAAVGAPRGAAERFYVVWIFDQEEPGWDMRCH